TSRCSRRTTIDPSPVGAALPSASSSAGVAVNAGLSSARSAGAPGAADVPAPGPAGPASDTEVCARPEPRTIRTPTRKRAHMAAILADRVAPGDPARCARVELDLAASEPAP